jgi:hypothetical protein
LPATGDVPIAALHRAHPRPQPNPPQLELLSLWRSGELERLLASVTAGDVTVNLVTLVACVSVLLAALAALLMSASRTVYLLDFAIYKPPERCAAVEIPWRVRGNC